ncbi:MAG: type II secretion system GspH family protein [Desulfobulbaceae bacterium]|nr:type II secretion system GspH family protein [Desulfobulbaceae bacterium]
MSGRFFGRESGFTLIEIIVALMILSIVGVFVMQLFGSSFVASTTPLTQLQNSFDLQGAMEEMTDDYNSGTPLADLQTRVNSEAYGNGASYTVSENRFVTVSGSTFVEAASDAPKDLLRVTIQAANGETLTTLFSAQ